MQHASQLLAEIAIVFGGFVRPLTAPIMQFSMFDLLVPVKSCQIFCDASRNKSKSVFPGQNGAILHAGPSVQDTFDFFENFTLAISAYVDEMHKNAAEEI